MRKAINGLFILSFSFVAAIFVTAPAPQDGELEALAQHMTGSVHGASGLYFDTLYEARNATEPRNIQLASLD